jgi:hypothetical protein
MTVKELCLTLCEMRERGEISDDTPVHFLCFDSPEYIAHCGISEQQAAEFGYTLDGSEFYELVTDIGLKPAEYTETGQLTNIICLS